jgi:hypothetical protein
MVSAFDFLSTSSAAFDEQERTLSSPNSRKFVNETTDETKGSPLKSKKQIDLSFETTACVEAFVVPIPVDPVIESPTCVSEDLVSLQSITPKSVSVEKMELITDLILELTELQNFSIAKHREIRSEIEATNRTSVDLRARLTSLELEQSRLAQEEEFEHAEAMSIVIDSARADLEANADHIRSLTVSAVILSESFAFDRKSFLSRIASAQNELTTVKNSLEAELSVSSDLGVLSRSRGDDLEEARLRAEQERIFLEKSHFEREEEALTNELQVTEDAIRTQSGDYQATRELVVISLLSVQSEIRHLELQLVTKRQEETGLMFDLTQVEGKIGDVRKKYERQLQRIQDRSQALAATKYECLEEEHALVKEYEVFSLRIRELLEAREVMAHWTSAVKNNLSVLLAFMEDINRNDELLESHQRTILTLVSAISSCDSTDSQYSDLQRSLDEHHVLLLGAQNALEGLESQMTALTTESRSISEQIPKLEVEKKTHASSKRFKEAAAVAKDLKDFLVRREQIDSDVASVGAAMDEQSSVVAACRHAHGIAAEELKEAHRQQDIVRFDALLVLSHQLRRSSRGIADARASDPAFVDGDFEPIKSLYAAMERLVNDELSFVLFEAEIIKQEHSLLHSLEEELEMKTEIPLVDSEKVQSFLDVDIIADEMNMFTSAVGDPSDSQRAGTFTELAALIIGVVDEDGSFGTEAESIRDANVLKTQVCFLFCLVNETSCHSATATRY